jgi:hypothetical protein
VLTLLPEVVIYGFGRIFEYLLVGFQFFEVLDNMDVSVNLA